MATLDFNPESPYCHKHQDLVMLCRELGPFRSKRHHTDLDEVIALCIRNYNSMDSCRNIACYVKGYVFIAAAFPIAKYYCISSGPFFLLIIVPTMAVIATPS